jgi:pimeloyl-ACP methyl ester carboxylesterase
VPQSDAQGVPNYASAANWLAIPAESTKGVDVFYLGDTTYAKPDPSSPNIGPIDDPTMQQGAQVKYTTTASVFEPIANVYAPYNRQVDAQFKSTLPIPEQLQLEAGAPTSDAVSAFTYYLEHLNGGRPFILAGHSQGSNLIANLLAGYLKEHPELYARMVAAYVIGYSITSDYLAQNPQLKFAQGPDETGVVISYNTEAPVMQVTNPVTMPGGVAINPITWTTSQTPAGAAQSLGSLAVDPQTGGAVLDDAGNLVITAHYADATVDKARGIVICSTADPNQLAPGNSALQAGIYHGFDYPLYYVDIRANAANRIAHYLADH